MWLIKWLLPEYHSLKQSEDNPHTRSTSHSIHVMETQRQGPFRGNVQLSPGWSMEQYARAHRTKLSNVDADKTDECQEGASFTSLSVAENTQSTRVPFLYAGKKPRTCITRASCRLNTCVWSQESHRKLHKIDNFLCLSRAQRSLLVVSQTECDFMFYVILINNL